MHFSSQWISRT